MSYIVILMSSTAIFPSIGYGTAKHYRAADGVQPAVTRVRK
jgi:hypothetical protein